MPNISNKQFFTSRRGQTRGGLHVRRDSALYQECTSFVDKIRDDVVNSLPPINRVVNSLPSISRLDSVINGIAFGRRLFSLLK